MWGRYFFSFGISSKKICDEPVHHKQLISSVWKLMNNLVYTYYSSKNQLKNATTFLFWLFYTTKKCHKPMILFMILVVSSHLHKQIPYDRVVDKMSYCTFGSITVYFLHYHGKFVLTSVTKTILKFIYFVTFSEYMNFINKIMNLRHLCVK